jgi:hypothetical protein
MVSAVEVDAKGEKGAKPLVLPLTLKQRLSDLLDQSHAEADTALISFYFSLTAEQASECLLLLTARQNYRDLERFLVFRPDTNVRYANAVGDTALHLAFAARPLDFGIIHLLCDKGGLLDTKNAAELAPLQLLYSLPDSPADILQMFIDRWSEKLALTLIQEIFEEASRRHWHTLSFYLLDKFRGQLNVKAKSNTASDQQPIHALILAESFDPVVLTQLHNAGARLQDKSNTGKSGLELLFEAKAYDRMALLAAKQPELFTLDELIMIFQTLLSIGRYDLCKTVLIKQASNEAIDSGYLKQMLGHTARHLSLSDMTRVISTLWQEHGVDARLLKFIDVALDADIPAKKEAVVTLCRGVLQKMPNPDEVLALVNTLEAQTQLSTTPNLRFLRERGPLSLHSHSWKGLPASGTWVSLMQEAQRRCALAGGVAVSPVLTQFLQQPTREGFLGFFGKREKQSVQSASQAPQSSTFSP